MRGIHQLPVDSPHKGPVTRKRCPCHIIIMPLAILCRVQNLVTITKYQQPLIQTSGNPPVLGLRPLKTVEDWWKPLLCQSSCPVKNSCREPLYGDSIMSKKIRSCKRLGGPVKLGFSMWLLVLQSGKSPKCSRCLFNQGSFFVCTNESWHYSLNHR